MTGTRCRPRYLIAFGAVAVPLVAASIAYACGALASISVTPASGDVGATVEGVGRGFSNSHGGAPSSEPVVIHFDSRNGPVLWSGRPDGSGNIEFRFTVPQVAPGSYTLIATQNNADGVPAPGTPARAAFTVTGPAPAPAAAPVAAAPQPTAAAPAPAPAAAPTGTATASPTAATAPRVRVAPTQSTATAGATASAPAAAPAPAATPAPAAAPAADPAAAPAPAVESAPAPAVESAPAPAPARRTAMVSMAGGDDGGSSALAIALVGIGVVLAVGATAMVLAGRRDRGAPARARR